MSAESRFYPPNKALETIGVGCFIFIHKRFLVAGHRRSPMSQLGMLGGGRMPLACNRQQTKRSALRAPKPNVVMMEAMMFSPASPVSFVMRHRTIPRPVSANAYPPAFLSVPWTSPPNQSPERNGCCSFFSCIIRFRLADAKGQPSLSFFR